MGTVLRAIDRKLVEDMGYRSGSDAEDAAVRRIHRWCPVRVTQEHRVGRWRLDFAWPEIKVGIEIDGPHHRNPDTAFRDAERDRNLREQGWVILRVTAWSEDELSDAVLVVNALLKWHQVR